MSIPFQREIEAAARDHQLRPALVAAVARQESGFDPGAYRWEEHLGEASYGLMQTLESTARWLGFGGAAEDLYDPATSLEFGCRMLAWCRERTDSDRQMLAAYNAGLGGLRHGYPYADQVLGRVAALEAEMNAIDVPFVSQLEDADRQGWMNCGPACLTQLGAWAGAVEPDTETLHRTADFVRDGYYDGDHWQNSYTDYPLMQWLAENEWGLRTAVLRSWDAVHGHLARGVPVMILLNNAPLQPRQYPSGRGWDANHFIVLRGHGDGMYAVSDPLAYYHPRGPGSYTAASVRTAVQRVGGVYALALESQGEDMARIAELEAKVAELDSTNSALADQVQALRAEVDGLNGQNTERQSQIDALREELGVVRADKATVETQLSEAHLELAELKARPGAAPAQITRVVVTYDNGTTQER